MTGARVRQFIFLGGLLASLTGCNVYKSDVGKLCEAEQLSQSSLKSNRAQLFAWMERNVASAEGIGLVKDIETRDAHGIAVRLRDEMRKVALPLCALAETAELQAKDEDYHTDLVNLCAGSAAATDGSVARLDIVDADDAERMREMTLWTATNGKSPDTGAVVAKMVAVAPRQRGALLVAEAKKVGVSPCQMAAILDAPRPPPPAPSKPHGNPTFVVLKVDGPAKDQQPIGILLTSQDPAAAINACYAVALAVTPTLAGKLAMRLAFDGMGHITKATDDGSTLKDAALLECVTNVMLGLALNGPPPDGGKKGAVATATLNLTPAMTGPGFTATVDPAWMAKAARARRR